MTIKNTPKDYHRSGYYKEYRENKKGMANLNEQNFGELMDLIVEELGIAKTAGILNNAANKERMLDRIITKHEKFITDNEDFLAKKMNDVSTAPLYAVGDSTDLLLMSNKERAVETERLKARLLILENIERNEKIRLRKEALDFIDEACDLIRTRVSEAAKKKRTNRQVASGGEESISKIANTTGSFIGGLVASFTGGLGGADKN